MIKSALFLFILLLASCYWLFAKPAFAQTIEPKQDLPAGRQDLHNYTQRVMIEVASSMTCLIAGVDAINPTQKCLGVANGKIGPVDSKGGAVGVMGNLITMTFTPPFHTADYVRYLAGNFGISKPAYAADQTNGIGFANLNPLLSVWTAFRNITYLLFVIVFVVIGFAIMLRVHIDPRTVMTIENQIPKIIIGLILVTFSFAIAGFLIDLMYFFIYLSVGIFSSIPGTTSITPTFYNMQGLNPLEVANNLPVQGPGGVQGILGITMNAAGSVKDVLVNSIFSGPPGKIIAFALGTALGFGGAHGFVSAGQANATAAAAGAVGGAGICAGTVVGLPAAPICAVIGSAIAQLITGAIVGGLSATFSDQVLGSVAAIFAFLAIGIALLFALFRLWFTLIQSYVFILIDVVLSPFWVIGGLIPGSSIGFTAWLRDLGANLLAFPATVIMFLLGKVFIEAFNKAPANSFAPPLIGNANSPNLFGSLIGLGIILLTPSVVDMIKAALKAPKFDLGAVGAAVGVGAGAANPLGMLQRATAFGSTLYWAHQTPILGNILGRMEGPKKKPKVEEQPPPHTS